MTLCGGGWENEILRCCEDGTEENSGDISEDMYAMNKTKSRKRRNQ